MPRSRLGGQLYVSSQINVGTQFWFELALPVVDYNVAKVSNQQLIIGVKGDAPKILVVDDNLENRSVVVDLLAPLGFNVEPANDGREGLEKAKQVENAIKNIYLETTINFETYVSKINMEGIKILS